MPVEYIYAPWTAPVEVQEQANCVIGKVKQLTLFDLSTYLSNNMSNSVRYFLTLLSLFLKSVHYTYSAAWTATAGEQVFVENKSLIPLTHWCPCVKDYPAPIVDHDIVSIKNRKVGNSRKYCFPSRF